MEVKVNMSYVNDEKFQVINKSGNKLIIDMYSQDKKENHSPMELLLSAVVSCAAVDIVSMIRKRKRNFKDIKGEASGIRAETHPKFFKSITIHYVIYSSDLTDKEAGRFITLAIENYCSVGSTINEKTNINYSFSIKKL
tara:strand:+ start:86 stop:502 length:417 start_codon:yes stop_codon:yes gene_type:complete